MALELLADKEEIEDEVGKGKQVKNLKLVRYDISRINDILGPEDKINRIYINFLVIHGLEENTIKED